MIPINNLRQTCTACPSQWEFTTFENRPVYVRYRWGCLSIRIGVPDGDVTSAVNGQKIIDTRLGDEWDGLIEWSYVENQLKNLTKNKIISIIKKSRDPYETV